jgi:prefoldin subunit 5
MNLRIADEYNELGDFAAGLRVFVERLKLKNDNIQRYVERIDEMEKEIDDLEHIITKLNESTGTLEAKLRKAYVEMHTD